MELIKSWTNAWEVRTSISLFFKNKKIFKGEYDQIRLEVRDPRKGRYDDAHSELAWTPKRYEHTLKVRLKDLNFLLRKTINQLLATVIEHCQLSNQQCQYP